MKINSQYTLALVAFMGFTLSFVSNVKACGPNWSIPQDHFPGVNEFGYVSLWDQIGTLDLGEDLKIPLIIGFQSDRQWSSPYLGQGWILALLDSRIEQVDERTFIMTGPDGLTRNFARRSSNDTILQAGDWKAEIKDNTITAWASCGWRLAYVKGRLTSIITPKNGRLDFVFANGRVSEVQNNGSTLIRLETDSVTGRTKALSYQGKRIEIAQDQRPQVQCINGQNVIGGMGWSLSSVKLADGSTKAYEYAVNDKLQPTLKMGARLVAWDSASKRILKDGEWSYQITPRDNPLFNAAIQRTNAQKQVELWDYDALKGREITQSLNGDTIIRTWYVSGALSGKIREFRQISSSIGLQSVKYSYNEKGDMIREQTPNITIMYENGVPSKVIDGKLGQSLVNIENTERN